MREYRTTQDITIPAGSVLYEVPEVERHTRPVLETKAPAGGALVFTLSEAVDLGLVEIVEVR